MTKSELIDAILGYEPERREADLVGLSVATLRAMFEDCVARDEGTHQTPPTPKTQPAAAQAPMMPADPAAAGQALAAMIQPYLPTPTVDVGEIIASAEARLDAKIASATFPTRVIVERRETGDTHDLGVTHRQLPQLLRLVSRGLNVWIYGAPGGGKSHVCSQVAEALGHRFGFMAMSSQTTRTMLTGFTDATGKIVSTPLRDFVENGGVFLMDEADKAGPAIMADVHSLLSQRKLATPDGHIDAHRDFILLVAANTAGLGGMHGHETAQKADTAFRSRFAFLEWTYDVNLERALALAINPASGPWIDWIIAVRDAVNARPTEWRVAIDPRATYTLAQLIEDHDVFTRDEMADLAVFKGCDPGTRTAILKAHPMPALKATGTKKELF